MKSWRGADPCTETQLELYQEAANLKYHLCASGHRVHISQYAFAVTFQAQCAERSVGESCGLVRHAKLAACVCAVAVDGAAEAGAQSAAECG